MGAGRKKHFEIQDPILPEKVTRTWLLQLIVCFVLEVIFKKKSRPRHLPATPHHPPKNYFKCGTQKEALIKVHVHQAKIQVSLHIWAVWTGSSLSA